MNLISPTMTSPLPGGLGGGGVGVGGRGAGGRGVGHVRAVHI